ncbi:DUF3500 domain-containing protein [Actinopolymorpha alba]|uniref:DUF3500 domain-containing protein n=1 Tax=Actinopolymorpha alba TaxID=533267 RepID=UPI00036D9C3E|nr:DUF3500 domain-containing protein [Actinopolymorpha alba]
MSGFHQPRAARRMTAAATAFLAALEPHQRTAATAPFDTADHREWTYLPGSRPGLALLDMDQHQRERAMELLDTGLSERSAAEARAIMELETILRELERAAGRSGWERRHRDHFWFRILGDPAGTAPWAWRVNGHHLAVHLTVVGDAVAATPQFFGANPAVVPSGPHAGHRTNPAYEDLARDLLAALTPDQRPIVISDPVASDDILTRHDPVADVGRVPRGLAYADMTEPQRELLKRLVRRYLDRVTPDVAQAAWLEAVDAGLERVTFSWAGSDERGRGHYYAVVGPTFLLEYDNVQNNANHVHTVWRDLRHDWGEDLLAAHYAAHHS